ncbi:organic solute transporter subunit alpha-like [Saccoglossus kowalevskii]
MLTILDLDVVGIIIVTSCTVCTLAVLAFYIEAAIYLYKRISNLYRRIAILWVLGIYPVHCVFPLIGLYIPRAALIVNTTAASYLSVSVYLFLVLVLDMYGGETPLHMHLKGTTILLKKLPLFCCCTCLPELKLKSSTIRKIKLGIYQIAVLRPAVLYFELLYWADSGYASGNISLTDPYIYLHTATAISTIIAVYCMAMLYSATKLHLQGYRIHAKFRCLQITMFLANIQSLVISIFTSTGLIPCFSPIDWEARSWWYHDFLQVYEMTIIFFAAHAFYRQEKGNVDNVVKLSYSKQGDTEATIHVSMRDARAFHGNIGSIEKAFSLTVTDDEYDNPVDVADVPADNQTADLSPIAILNPMQVESGTNMKSSEKDTGVTHRHSAPNGSMYDA